MKQVLEFLKKHAAFFVLFVISVVFFLIALFGGPFQHAQFLCQDYDLSFINGHLNGVPFTLAYVIIPIVSFVALLALNFTKPKKRDGKIATLYTALFIAIATLAGALIVAIPIALFNMATPRFHPLGDWKAQSDEIYFVKEYYFPYLAMIIGLLTTIVTSCYCASTLSE